MISGLERWSIEKLTALRKSRLLLPNWEYQRGPVWGQPQARLFIDSVLRGYQIPLIYLRESKRGDDEYGGTRYEIIDGQQRINALFGFCQGVFIRSGETGEYTEPFLPLLNPANGKERDMFPPILQELECAWAGKIFNTMSDPAQEEFKGRKLDVAILRCRSDEARHLFIRLQRGSSLTPQEKRDAWPGTFCGKILDLGGKPELYKPGHDFFRKIMKLNPGGAGGSARKVAAQLLMVFMEKRDSNRFVSVSSKYLDRFYRQHYRLEVDSNLTIRRFEEILKKLTVLFGRAKHEALKTHEAIHLLLFSSMLDKDYSREWEAGIVDAHEQFRAEVNKCKDSPLSGGEDENFVAIWNYAQNVSGGGSGDGEVIKQRHNIYCRQMLRFLGNKAKKKDPQRAYASGQRRQVYDIAKGLCSECGEKVEWDDAEIHHITPHSQGGRTTLENAALVHPWCHPGG